jgi:predicted transcriptional regulator
MLLQTITTFINNISFLSNMEILEELKLLGLSGNAAKVYLQLTKLGEANANMVAKKSGLDRSLTYTVLNNLIDKGLVSYIIKDKKRIFKTNNPKNLLLELQEKEQLAQALIPKLLSIKSTITDHNSVEVLEGKEGFKKALEELLRQKGNGCVYGGRAASFDLLKWEMPHLTKKFIVGKKHLRALINSKHINHDFCKLKNIQAKGIDGLDEEATTSVLGDLVMIHILKEKPFVILIRSKAVADNYRSVFEKLWEKY